MTSEPHPPFVFDDRPRFQCVHLRWRLARSSAPFRVNVVEPLDYGPASHDEVFFAVVTGLLSPEPERLESRSLRLGKRVERFDLVTFPEAFVSTAAILMVLPELRRAGPTGCFHVGLRSVPDRSTHLLRVHELQDFLASLTGIGVVAADLEGFANWLAEQDAGAAFNVGAVFAVDANGELRVCLHPKIVRAQVEVATLPEHHMEEADLLTLITVVPEDSRLLTVTIQPLLCSDLLDLDTDEPDGSPMRAVTRFAGSFAETAPDHVDIVSVAACTPQRRSAVTEAVGAGQWPEQFTDAFESAAKAPGLARHHFAAIVLANFRRPVPERAGGLSGAFLPLAPGGAPFHKDVVVSAYGRVRKSEAANAWSLPEDDAQAKWECRGFVAGLDPYSEPLECPVRIFAFDIHRLPRAYSRWVSPSSLARCTVRIGQRDTDGTLRLKVKASDDE